MASSPFVVALLGFPLALAERDAWLHRSYAAFVASSGLDSTERERPDGWRTVADLSPGQEESMLYDVGFSNTRLFYAGLHSDGE